MGKTLFELAKQAQPDYPHQIILAKVDGKLHELKDMEIENEKVEYITTAAAVGNETYRRSVVLLMLHAIYQTAPEHSIDRVTIEYSISKGLYCSLKADFQVTEEFLARVKTKMQEIVAADIPITKRMIQTSEAVKLFEKYGMEDKTKLFKYRRSSYVNIYNLDGFEDYFYGYMAPSTGMLGVFDLFLYDEGFVLQLPVKEAPEIVPEFAPQQKLFQVLKESTQWANMLGGTELIRKKLAKDAHAMTITLLTNSEGKKMGKTEKGAVWLDPEKTSPYDFFQYWRNVGDNDVIKCLKLLTFLPIEQIEEMERTMTGAELNKAKELLAYELTSLIHGKEEADKCLEAAKKLFGGAGNTDDMPTTEIPAAELEGGINILDLLVKTALCPSKSEARRLVQQGGVSVDDVKVTDPNAAVEIAESVIIKKGKKVYHKVARA